MPCLALDGNARILIYSSLKEEDHLTRGFHLIFNIYVIDKLLL